MRTDTNKPGRGRPRAYDPDAALDRVRDAFWSAGYSATSLDDLSAATGMNRPSLYAAFGNKQALYLTTLQRLNLMMEAQVGAVLDSDLSLVQALRRFYARALEVYFSGEQGARGCYVVCTATAEAHTDAAVRALLEGTLRHIDTALATRLRRAQAEGELPADADVEMLARIAAATLHSLAVRARAGQSRASLKRLGDATARLIAGESASLVD